MDNQQQKLKSLLPKGAVKRVAIKHSVTVQHVNKIMNGLKNNPEILLSLVEEAEFAKQVQERMQSL